MYALFMMVPEIKGASTPLGPLEAHRLDRNMGCTTPKSHCKHEHIDIRMSSPGPNVSWSILYKGQVYHAWYN